MQELQLILWYGHTCMVFNTHHPLAEVSGSVAHVYFGILPTQIDRILISVKSLVFNAYVCMGCIYKA